MNAFPADALRASDRVGEITAGGISAAPFGSLNSVSPSPTPPSRAATIARRLNGILDGVTVATSRAQEHAGNLVGAVPTDEDAASLGQAGAGFLGEVEGMLARIEQALADLHVEVDRLGSPFA